MLVPLLQNHQSTCPHAADLLGHQMCQNVHSSHATEGLCQSIRMPRICSSGPTSCPISLHWAALSLTTNPAMITARTSTSYDPHLMLVSPADRVYSPCCRLQWQTMGPSLSQMGTATPGSYDSAQPAVLRLNIACPGAKWTFLTAWCWTNAVMRCMWLTGSTAKCISLSSVIKDCKVHGACPAVQ